MKTGHRGAIFHPRFRNGHTAHPDFRIPSHAAFTHGFGHALGAQQTAERPRKVAFLHTRPIGCAKLSKAIFAEAIADDNLTLARVARTGVDAGTIAVEVEACATSA